MILISLLETKVFSAGWGLREDLAHPFLIFRNKRETLHIVTLDFPFWERRVKGPSSFLVSRPEFAQKKAGVRHGHPEVAGRIPMRLVLASLTMAAWFLDPVALRWACAVQGPVSRALIPSTGVGREATSYSPEGGIPRKP